MTAPVLIVGAGRSGTNLLASTFDAEGSRFRNLVENRYIWTYGQRDRSTDLRAAAEATPRVAGYIRSHFARQAGQGADAPVLIDKTPSNALRLPFVAAVYPDVKVINMLRDGRDNIVSRTNQWEGRLPSESSDVHPAASLRGKLRIAGDRLRHARHLHARGNLPLDRFPAMLTDMAPTVLAHLLTGQPRRYAERVPGLAHIRRTAGLDVAAAVQWREVVMAAVTEGRRLGCDRYLELRYEDLLADPAGTWGRIMGFLKVTETGAGRAYLEGIVRPAAHGAWRDSPDAGRVLALEAHLRPTLEYLGYGW